MNALAQAFLLVLAVSPATRGHPFFDGRLAQRLERSPHTREIKGSNPLSPTTSIHGDTKLRTNREVPFRSVSKRWLLIQRGPQRRSWHSWHHKFAPTSPRSEF